MQKVLRGISGISFIVAIIWVIQVKALEPEPILAFLGGLTTLALSFANEKNDKDESLDQRNRRVMLDHVENFWVKGVLEKSLHGVSLLELGITEDPTAINYPWGIKTALTNETLPAGKSMYEIFKEIGLGRSLLVLGAPGSGKSTMLYELSRQLVEIARQDEIEPIPVVFNLSSWTEKLSLADWLAEQLNIFYYVPKKTAQKLVIDNKMFLLLDGLDEVKEDIREKCVNAINEFKNQYGLNSLVICSRIEEYQVIQTKLALAGAITLQPLTSEQVDSYFDKFGKSLSNLKQILKKDKTLGELTETPLMLSIMVLAYKDVNIKEIPELKNIKEQRKHLFNTYIHRMFERSENSEKKAFTKEDTNKYLGWIAGKMISHNSNNYGIESIQPNWLENKSQKHLYQFFSTLIGMLIIVFLTTMIFKPVTGIIFGIIIGVFIGLLYVIPLGTSKEIIMVEKLSWNLNRSLTGFIFGFLFGRILTPILNKGLNLNFDISFPLLIGLLVGLTVGIKNRQMEQTTQVGQRLRQTTINAFVLFISICLIIGMIFGFNIGLLFVGLVSSLDFGIKALIQHYSLRYVLIIYSYLPQSQKVFLDSCVDLIFLRRVGGSYIFVHRLLMEHFAETYVEKENK